MVKRVIHRPFPLLAVQKIFGSMPCPNLATVSVALFRNPRLAQDELDAASFAKEVGLIEKVAKGMSTPDEYPFRTVCRAAAFIAQYFPGELPSLLQS